MLTGSWCLHAVVCLPVRHADLRALSFSLGENHNASGILEWQRKLAFILATFRQMSKCLE